MVALKKIKIIAGIILLAAVVLAIMPGPAKVYADRIQCINGSYSNVPAGYTGNLDNLCLVSGGSIKPGASVEPDTPILPSDTPQEQPKFIKNDCGGGNIQAGKPVGDPDHCGILDYVTIFIKALSALVGVVVVANIIIGGIQYSASGDDPGAVGAAKKRIFNAILALAVYAFMFALLQYLIPGGVLQ